MKKIFAIAWKDLIVRFASKSELLFFIVLPLVFTFLLAGGTPSSSDDNRIRLVVVDQAQTTLSQQLIAGLGKSTAVRPDVLTLNDAESEFKERRVSVMLIIPVDFGRGDPMGRPYPDLQLRQQPNSLDALVAERAVQAVTERVGSAVSIALKSVAEAEKLKAFESDAARQTYFETALAQAQTLMDTAPQRVDIVRAATKDQIDYDPRANSSAGQLITWVFIPLLGISSLFAYERQQGTLRRLLTTPTARATFLIGTISGQVLVSLGQMLLLVTFGALVMGVQWGRDPLALALVLVTFALAAAALGTTLGTFIKSEGQATGVSVLLGMVMALMGGCWYPLEMFPTAGGNIVKILPTTWAMQGLLTLVLRGGGLTDILPTAGVLLGFALVFFTVGVWRFRFE
jgi:ABC-2 type transport system permease protein